MPALPSQVTAYIDSLITRLTVGPAIGQNAVAGPANGLSALDAANALELLQEACSTSVALEAAALSTASVINAGVGTFAAGRLVGSYVLVVSSADPANDGEVRRIIANTATSITVDEPFPAAIAEDDTYQIVAGVVDEAIETLRSGKEASRAVNTLTGESRTFLDGIGKLVSSVSGTVRNRALMTTTFGTGSTTSDCVINNRGSSFVLNGLVGYSLVNATAGTSRPIVANTENTITVDPPFASAPTNGQVARIDIPEIASNAPQVIRVPNVGFQQENAIHADMLRQAAAAVTSYVLPAYTNP